jgi:hypothetical protein
VRLYVLPLQARGLALGHRFRLELVRLAESMPA